ncbi:MAG: PspA/IM30 family protein [Deltaproteobacteria bacterium]|nr:PspA/IM30 family protein [Deltaproteobacteria bacterium]
MGIFDRIRTLLASNINAAITKAEDPEKMLEQLVLDMQKQFTEARQQVAVAMADEQRLKKQHENESRIAAEWEAKARKALGGGDEALAREILVRKAEHDRMAGEYKVQWDQQAAAVEQLRSALQQLNTKIEEAKRKKNLLVARAKRAEAQRKIHDTMSGLSDSSAFEGFSRMEGKVDQLEAEATVATQFAGELAQGDDLNKRVAQLESKTGGGEVDAQLAALKASMAVPEIEAPKK